MMAENFEKREAQLLARIREKRPRVHCITNPVTMNDVANLLLAAGGTAIMAQAPEEVADITAQSSATLLNTGVPDETRWQALSLAGKRANALGHPVVLDPVGAGADAYRREGLRKLLSEVRPGIIRCNAAEARTLLDFCGDAALEKESATVVGDTAADSCVMEQGACPERTSTVAAPGVKGLERRVCPGDAFNVSGPSSGGVDGALGLSAEEAAKLCRALAQAFGCTALISGAQDWISDGNRVFCVSGGDARMSRLTGGGCMLSALCALFACGADAALEAAVAAACVWKRCAAYAARLCAARCGEGAGMGSFHTALFDAADLLCFEAVCPPELGVQLEKLQQ